MGIFGRMYGGNPNRPDFREEDLPDNRFKLFFEVLKVNWGKLIELNLLYLVLLIPAMIWSIINLSVFNTMIKQKADIYSYLFTYLLFLIPCLVIAGPAQAGLTYVLRNWARDDHAWVFEDFKDAAIKNWKDSMLVMLINGILLFLFCINIRFYSKMGSQNIVYLFFKTVLILFAVIYSMMNLYIFPMIVTYKLKLREVFKNAFIFTLARLPYSFLFLVIEILPAALILVISPLIVIIFYLIIGFAFMGLIQLSYTNSVFDKYINTHIEGVEVNKGMRKDDDVDDNEDDNGDDDSDDNNDDK